MTRAVVHDRYIRLAPDLWRDLATGHAVRSTGTGSDDGGDRAATINSAADRIARATQNPDRGTEVIEMPVEDEREALLVAHGIAPRLVTLGFVPIRADLVLSTEVRRELAHRHVALLMLSPSDTGSVAGWLRTLSEVSGRAHLVIAFRHGSGVAAPTGASVVRERAPVWFEEPGSSNAMSHSDIRWRRAERFTRRGRHAQAERWYRAALESARRRHDDPGQLAACRATVELLSARDEWDAACQLARSVLTTVRDTSLRAEVAALMAGALIVRAELGAADAALSMASAELAVAGLPVPARIHDTLAELRFWQGRVDEAVAVPRTPASIGRLMVDGAIAWLRRDATALAGCRRHAASLPSTAGGFCQGLMAVLEASVSRRDHELGTLVEELARQGRRLRCPRLRRLGRALVMEAQGIAGLPYPAMGTATGREAERSAPQLDRLFLEWQRSASESDRRREHQAAMHLSRVGACIVETWRWGCRDMQLVHAIPKLLQLIQEAEDDLAALVAACSWVRREGHGAAVAFLDPDRALVVGDGWTAGDMADAAVRDPSEDGRCAEPLRAGDVLLLRVVRYAGAVTGFVAIRGRGERHEALAEAASTIAALCGPALRAHVDLVHTMRAGPALSTDILGCSPSMVALREAVARAAAVPFSVLVEGESGTGKELVARAIHRLSPRRDRRFVAVNCAALTDELVEAELFGHTRGAFTGAIGARTGLVEDAHGGSLFLDEVSELSPRAQAKLLRVLQEREVRRVGENAPRSVDVRVIAATNRPLSEAVQHGAFREDLLFRLAVIRLRVPPLRDRIEDVPLLAQASWRALSAQTGKRAMLGPDAVAHLCRHPWPGNVRELQNAMAALLVMAPDRGRVSARHVSHVLSAASEAAPLPALPLHRARTNVERTAVAGALARHGGRRALAARELGLTRQGLAKAMKRLGLAGPDSATRQANGAESGVA